MKSGKVISVAVLTLTVMSGVANAAISGTQTWHIVNDQVQNTSNGKTLCMSDVALEQATMEVCGSNPKMQTIRRVNFDLEGSLRLDANPTFGYSPFNDKVIVREFEHIRDHWEYNKGQLKSTDAHGVTRCLDIDGGKNVQGAKVYLAACTN